MKARLYISIIALFCLLAAIVITAHEKADADRGPYCFSGTVSVDGSPAEGIEVTLTIGDEWDSDYSDRNGDYEIGSTFWTGDYCLKAVISDQFPEKRDAAQGYKRTSGTLYEDLNLTSTGPSCVGHDD